jgi:hypothetical protein
MKTHIRLVISLLAAFALLVASTFAQKPSPSPAPSAAKPPFQMPDMGAMYSQMMNAMYTELTRPERAAALAHFQKLYYDALIKEGFTKEEALSILRANQLPMTGVK